MSTPSTIKQPRVPAGRIYFDPLVSGSYQGERYLGKSDAFTVTIAGEKLQEFEAESGLRQLWDETLVGITRTGKIVIKQISPENEALFVGGAVSTQVQAAGSVTAERLVVTPDRYYQLGATNANPSGVRDVSAVTVTYEGASATAWAATTALDEGDLIKPTTSPTRYYRVAVAGTTGAAEPTWPTVVGESVTNGGVVLVLVGNLVAGTPTVDDDFTLDSTLGRLYITPTGTIAAGTAVLVNYTKSARERLQIKTSAMLEARGRLRLVADNVRGDNRDWFFPDVNLVPNGDYSLKTESPAYLSMAFDIGIQTPDRGAAGEEIAAIYVDGRAMADSGA